VDPRKPCDLLMAAGAGLIAGAGTPACLACQRSRTGAVRPADAQLCCCPSLRNIVATGCSKEAWDSCGTC